VTDALHCLAGLYLLLLTVSRVQMLRDSGMARSLWVALAALGLCQFLQVSWVYRGLEQQAGLVGITALVIHSLTVLAAAAVRELHNSVNPDLRGGVDRRHVRLAVGAVLLMWATYAAAPPDRVPDALLDRSEYYDETAATALIWAVYLAYLNWALAGMFSSARRLARQAQPGPLRTGLTIGAAGLGVGFGYVALKVVVVLAWLGGDGPKVVRLDAVAEAAVLACSLLLIGTGSAFEVISDQVRGAGELVRHRRSLRRLTPLAQSLQQAAAGVGYNLPVRGGRQRLILRVTEIRDAQRTLRGYVAPETVSSAAAAARAAGHADRALVLAEAAALELGRRAKERGDRVHASVVREPAGGRDLREEVQCLEQLAQAQDHPFVRQWVQAHDNASTPQLT
jgi:hypothetical protein